MAKRFTDTNKWNKESFQEMSIELKLIWLYLCDNCDHAGIYDLNLGLMSFQLGIKITMEDLMMLGDKIEITSSKIFIPNFIEFQYGELNHLNRVHASVIKCLESFSKNKTLISPLQGAKDKDKDKDKAKDKEKKKEKESHFDFKILYKKYCRQIGGTLGISRLKEMVKSDEDYQLLSTAIDNFNNYHRRASTEVQFISHFSTFVGTLKTQCWRDWVDPTTGSTKKVTKISTSQDLIDQAIGGKLDEYA